MDRAYGEVVAYVLLTFAAMVGFVLGLLVGTGVL